ncbi:TPA: RimK family alpha-L-glutamate ligase [Methanocaldococcus jannaschii]|uniref:Tetrahydromethanopterin:alpha-L-glutamate ligase n=2 Tax=Methanocaldococcus jannaschii TaxID=2190 RepID=MPTN_METJA|nr:tetrahydromethanopterin:alpha-L-glutamate ligase [Methanocaldococcus jannaschii]Q58037.1 RecName: Full=Tetrahydromethanopterin:alpha-L-glutamate ligase; AltName: Full=H(4)MPT:alpha-L-glutamate ligase [Methanocaldococcus jannaschii DSM 2661]AAB98615.1 ribosomal protein S6 modification protein 1 (rimK) [Methanocaldococcus jannaschii DSM 2661]HII59574.1 RimK family alpha-L-glutamate ligase [Methanocaldococcus jannaschii]
MKLGIITIERDAVVNDLIKSCEKYEVDYKVITPSNIVAGFNLDFKLKYYKSFLDELDCCFVRNLGWDSFFRFDVLKYLNHYIPVINPPDGIDRASNKFLTSVFLELNNLPQPKTVVTESINEAIVWIDKFEEAVLKPIFGCGGEGIVRVKKELPISTKLKILNEFKEKYNTFYIQEFIKPVRNEHRDIRAFVVDDEVVAAMYRIGGENWKNNVSQGGRVEKCEITEEIEKLALKAKNALGLFYAGVDLIESEDGLKVLEVNSTPSWIGLSKVSEVNIADKLLEKIIQYVKS